MRSFKRRQKVIVIGLGYVGLPLAGALTERNFECFGFDSDETLIESLSKNELRLSSVSSDELKSWKLKGLSFFDNLEYIPASDTYIICVPTPLNQEGIPDLAFIRNAGEKILKHLRPELRPLIILESTTYPGTTEEILKPILERDGLIAGKDFHLCFSPERVDPGNDKFGFRNIPKVVGGLTKECLNLGIQFYEKIVDEVVPAKGIKEAEMSKLLENTYRQVNIALVNELLLVSNEMNIDFWEVIKLSKTKPYGFHSFEPGPGVGGHCIPIDPMYLNFKYNRITGKNIRLVMASQEINNLMPEFITEKILQNHRNINKKILFFGITYKKNVKDLRESPALKIMENLIDRNIDFEFVDPYFKSILIRNNEIESLQLEEIDEEKISLGVLFQDHDYFFENKNVFTKIKILNTRGSEVSKKFGMYGIWLDI